MTDPASEPVTLTPAPSAWADMIRPVPADPVAHQFRDQLGLPADRPVVMGGHQAGLWHPGILAKYLAVHAFAKSIGAQPAWLVVDHDTNPAHELEYPARDGDTISKRTWDMSGGSVTSGATTGLIPPIDPTGLSTLAPANDEIGERLARVADALADNAHGSLARQLTLAAHDLLAGVAEPMPTIFSTHLARTDLFRVLVNADELRTMRETYNRAVENHAESGVRPLESDELPVWNLSNSGRAPVTDRTLSSIQPERLAPRALLMTGIVRLAACDLFVHGTGGGDTETGYDQAGDDWFRAWLGAELAPTVVATATRLLSLDGAHIPSEKEAEHAKWLAHNAKHNPSLLDDEQTAARKQDILERAERAKHHKQNPAPIFAELQSLLVDYRERHADRIAELEHEAQRLASARRDAGVLTDRTWSFCLHPRQTLLGLRDEIEAAFVPARAGNTR